ncbi:alpha/beta hydrolase [Falsiroseomonas sp. HC035]|uniref:alpha/beta hydrolase n=1 Tax=Falsiroseomonas sp. HC035 TaxID=3390999 RepID=UPI003D31D68E
MPRRKKPVPAVRDSTTIVFATNRHRLSDGFWEEADIAPGTIQRLWLGRARIGWVGDPMETESGRQLLEAAEISGEDDFADPVAGSNARVLDAWLADAAARGAVPLFYIHGFGNGFGDALQRAAQIEEFYDGEKLALAPLVFSWPSDGRVLDPQLFAADAGVKAQYLDDQRDAMNSAPALARLLREVWRARQRAAGGTGTPPRLVLLAHSMGNLALASGLAAMNNGLLTRELAGLFAQAVLASADLPNTCFEPGQPMRLLPLIADQVTVCISHDCTLSVASQFANGNKRLGHYGPARLDLVPEGVEVVDYFLGLDAGSRDRILAKGGTEWDVVQHQWYRNDLKARAALTALFQGKPPPHKPLDALLRVEAGRCRHAILE